MLRYILWDISEEQFLLPHVNKSPICEWKYYIVKGFQSDFYEACKQDKNTTKHILTKPWRHNLDTCINAKSFLLSTRELLKHKRVTYKKAALTKDWLWIVLKISTM